MLEVHGGLRAVQVDMSANNRPSSTVAWADQQPYRNIAYGRQLAIPPGRAGGLHSAQLRRPGRDPQCPVNVDTGHVRNRVSFMSIRAVRSLATNVRSTCAP